MNYFKDLQNEEKFKVLVILPTEDDEFFISTGEKFTKAKFQDFTQKLRFIKSEEGTTAEFDIFCKGIGQIFRGSKEDLKKCNRVFLRNGNLMSPYIFHTAILSIRSLSKVGSSRISHSVQVVGKSSLKSGRHFVEVKDGVLNLTDELNTDIWYTFNRECNVWESESKNAFYDTLDLAKFFEIANVAGEDRKSWAGLLCLSEEQKQRVTNVVKNFKEMLEVIGVKAYYDTAYGCLCFLNKLDPESCKSFELVNDEYHGGISDPQDNPSSFDIPYEAFFTVNVNDFSSQMSDYYGPRITKIKEQQK